MKWFRKLTSGLETIFGDSWKDPVWSKVISWVIILLITSLGTGLYYVISQLIRNISFTTIVYNLTEFFKSDVTINMSTLLSLFGAVFGFIFTLITYRFSTKRQIQEALEKSRKAIESTIDNQKSLKQRILEHIEPSPRAFEIENELLKKQIHQLNSQNEELKSQLNVFDSKNIEPAIKFAGVVSNKDLKPVFDKLNNKDRIEDYFTGYWESNYSNPKGERGHINIIEVKPGGKWYEEYKHKFNVIDFEVNEAKKQMTFKKVSVENSEIILLNVLTINISKNYYYGMENKIINIGYRKINK